MEKDHVTINRDVWNAEAAQWVDIGERLWAAETPVWGSWNLPEDQLSLLPPDMTGLDAIELGCGTGYVAGWMARRGARVTAIDVSVRQLATARRLARQHATPISFMIGNAEATGLPDACMDFAISEYGAAIWCPPAVWLAEAWRLLRPGGKLVFLGNHPMALLCAPLDGSPNDHRLHRPYRNLWGVDWTEVVEDPSGICFNLTHQGWMDLFADLGFQIDRYQELYAPEDCDHMRAFIPADWARNYPVEQVWHLHKPA